ncbi:MAG: hypothetical protein J1F20_06955 [Muribaculaceae bacterium]|nr:hypothetical protein [Muribaculaceae bacterium]
MVVKEVSGEGNDEGNGTCESKGEDNVESNGAGNSEGDGCESWVSVNKCESVL